MIIDLNGKKFSITSAMGYTMIEKGTSLTVEEIINNTDLEMYKDKERMKEEENNNHKNGSEDYSI